MVPVLRVTGSNLGSFKSCVVLCNGMVPVPYVCTVVQGSCACMVGILGSCWVCPMSAMIDCRRRATSASEQGSRASRKRASSQAQALASCYLTSINAGLRLAASSHRSHFQGVEQRGPKVHFIESFLHNWSDTHSVNTVTVFHTNHLKQLQINSLKLRVLTA